MNIIESYDKYSDKLEYLPLLPLALFYLADDMYDDHFLELYVKFIITMIVVILFMFLRTYLKLSSIVSALIISILWIIFTYIKRNYVVIKN